MKNHYRIQNKIHAFEEYSLTESNSVIEWTSDKPTSGKLFEAITNFVQYQPTPETGVRHDLPGFEDWTISTEEPVIDMASFLDGFAETAELDRDQASAHWAAFSNQLSDSERREIEAGGYDSGRAEGNRFLELFPTSELYKISDGNATERAATLEDAAGIAEDWYDYLVDDGKLAELPAPDLDASSLEALNSSIRDWENRIAEAMGHKAWYGHGNYSVSAGDEAGLNLLVSVRND